MNKKAILAVIALLVLLGGAVLVARFPRRQASQKWTMVDGSEFSLIKVTHGLRHEVIDGGWRDVVYPAIPQALRKKLKWNVAVYKPSPPSSNAVVVWVKFNQLAKPPTAPSFAFTTPQLRVAAEDENKLESAEVYPQFSSPTPGIYAFDLRNFPRRSKSVVLVFYDDSANTRPGAKVGETKVPNPFPSEAAPWKAETLPATHETNGLSVSLLKLQTGTNIWGWGSRAGGAGRKYSRADFDLHENGARATNWSVEKIHADAPTGEWFEPNTYGGGWNKEQFTFNFQGVFWLEEPAWKLTTELWRTSDFPAEELWTLRGVRVPEAQEVTDVNATTNILGVQVDLLGLCGTNASSRPGWGMGGGGRGWGPPGVSLYARLGAQSVPELHLVVAEVRDEEGRKLRANRMGTSGSTYSFFVETPTNSKTVDITLAASKRRVVEFLVKPELAK